MNTQESNKELLQKVVDFLVHYWLGHKKHFPNTSWSTVELVSNYEIVDPHKLFYNWVDTYPEFFTWVSVLANRRLRLRDIYHSVNRVIEAVRTDTIDEALTIVEEELQYTDNMDPWVLEQWTVEREKLQELQYMCFEQ